MFDIRPMVWRAEVIAPAADADTTVVLHVTYATLEQLCAAADDEIDLVVRRAVLN